MKNFRFFVLLACLVSLLIISGCDRRDLSVPTDPLQVSTKDADRVLSFLYDSDTPLAADYQIALFNTGRASKDVVQDIVVLTLGDSVFDLVYREGTPFDFGWFAAENHFITETTSVKLSINGSEVLSTTVVPIGKANAAFPSHYHYQLPLTLNWAVDGSNTYQFVRVESWDTFTVNDTLPYSKYVRRIVNNQASYTFPANCVAAVNGDTLRTAFFLCVEEVDYKLVHKNAVMVYQNEGQWYYPDEVNHPSGSIGNRLRELFRTISGHAGQ